MCSLSINLYYASETVLYLVWRLEYASSQWVNHLIYVFCRRSFGANKNKNPNFLWRRAALLCDTGDLLGSALGAGAPTTDAANYSNNEQSESLVIWKYRHIYGDICKPNTIY